MIEIYRITNLINDKCYVGQTKKGSFKRFQQHCKADSTIGKAIRKYGHDNFLVEVLDIAEMEEEANFLEHKYILENNCVIPNGYNMNEYGRLVGFKGENQSWYIGLKPDTYIELLEKDSLMFTYVLKIGLLTDKNFVIKINRQTRAKSWKKIYLNIECRSRAIQIRLKKFLTDNNLIVVENKVFKLNPDKFKIIY